MTTCQNGMSKPEPNPFEAFDKLPEWYEQTHSKHLPLWKQSPFASLARPSYPADNNKYTHMDPDASAARYPSQTSTIPDPTIPLLINRMNEIQILPPNTLTFNFSLIDISSNSTCRMRLSTFTPLLINPCHEYQDEYPDEYLPYHTILINPCHEYQDEYQDGRFGGQVSVTDIYHTIPYHTIPY